jgi:dipeptidase E
MALHPSSQLLLISSSVVYGKTYLDHAEEEIRRLLEKRARVLFVPYALAAHESYANKARQRFNEMGYELESIHQSPDARKSIESAAAIFIGGGNTFRLLKALQDRDLIGVIRSRVQEGTPYIGSSAGTVVSCPTIRTTNDMPIVEPYSLNSLGLIPFQINPHFQDADPNSRHMGETREERILQYLEENQTPVLGLRDAGILRIAEGCVTLAGSGGGMIFCPQKPPVVVKPGDVLGSLLLNS